MNNFQFVNPTKIIFGQGTVDQLGNEVAGYAKNVLLMYGGGSMKRTGLYNRVMSQLSAKGIEVHELGGVEPNPRLTTVRKGIDICRKNSVELVLAVGGGSVIDAAKAVACGVPFEGDVWDFYMQKAVPESALPIGTVLTISATASEMNGATVITNWEENLKRVFRSVHTFPAFSILDPILTYTVPIDQTINGSVDMMSHAFEQYFSLTTDTPLQERFCESIIKTVIENVDKVLLNPEDYSSRANLMLCGTYAWNAGMISVGMTGDWGSHLIEHEVSAIYDIAHGAGLAIIFPNWMKYVYRERIDRFVQFAIRVWDIDPTGKTEEEVALAGIQATRDFFNRIGAPATLADVGVGDENFNNMAEKAVRFGPIGQFKKLEQKDIVEILRMSQ